MTNEIVDKIRWFALISARMAVVIVAITFISMVGVLKSIDKHLDEISGHTIRDWQS